MKKLATMTVALFLILILAPEATKVGAENSGSAGNYSFFTNLFTDPKAHQIGDIVQVIISESAQALHQAARSNDHKTTSEVGPGAGKLNFIPLFGFEASSTSSAKGVSSRRESFQARIATRVVSVSPEGTLLIEGSRRVQINKDIQRITLRGEVRPQDIRRDNTVYSWNVANAEITYEGSDPGRPGRKVGIITRLLNILF